MQTYETVTRKSKSFKIITKMSKEEKKYFWNRIYGSLGNKTYRFYDTETAEKIKLKRQKVFKELLEQRLNQNKDD
jgi:DNA polymerase elongation subunit (family B)